MSPILKVVCYTKKQIVLEVNHLSGMYFHSKVQKKLFALLFIHKVFHLSFPEQYIVHSASSLRRNKFSPLHHYIYLQGKFYLKLCIAIARS